ncbi:MAG: hypothetical protein ABIR59_08165 [Gemmatimonadales bacterium]
MAGIVVLALMAGCKESPLSLGDLIAAQDRTAASVYVVFNPASCSFTAMDLEPLNLLYERHGVRVTAISLITFEHDSVRRRVQADFGIRFPMTSDSLSAWTRALAADGIAQPAVVITKRGLLHGVLLQDAVKRLAPLLATLFSVTLESSDASI